MVCSSNSLPSFLSILRLMNNKNASHDTGSDPGNVLFLFEKVIYLKLKNLIIINKVGTETELQMF